MVWVGATCIIDPYPAFSKRGNGSMSISKDGSEDCEMVRVGHKNPAR